MRPTRIAAEALRRTFAVAQRKRERRALRALASAPVRLTPALRQHSSEALLQHFRERNCPVFFNGLHDSKGSAALLRQLHPGGAEEIVCTADRVAKEHRWQVLGFGEMEFGAEVNWLLDPLSKRTWPLEYHADITLVTNDGSDVRVLWEINRLGHLLPLAQAFALTGEERFVEEIFLQLDGWRAQNPLGFGPNWSCAMEVALRAMNLLATFTLCRTAESLTADRLAALLQTFEQHGLHIQRNLEFSYLGNSNHYLTDLVGLLWLGIALPELSMAGEWRRWALSELLDEMEQQILPDGANHEGATGYHRFVLELFLYSFILCYQNGVSLDRGYLERLRSMIDYLQNYLRPDGSAPLIGDTDGSQVLPLVSHRASEHSYLLSLGAAAIRDPVFKYTAEATPEIIWTLGSAGVADYDKLEIGARPTQSRSFTSVGSYIQRHDDLFLHFNLRTGRSAGRSSHCHNDLLSIEVAAGGRSFIVDPGSYVYSANLDARHQFRSTAFHSTIAVDGVEQNTCEVSQPFRLGREARPLLVSWMSGESEDRVTGEHSGYERLPHPVAHRRSVMCYKPEHFWLVEDRLSGDGEHSIASRFHFAADLEVSIRADRVVSACDKASGTSLLVAALDSDLVPQLEPQFTSNHYGHKEASESILWEQRLVLPSKLRWILIPVRSGESETARLKLAAGRVNGDGTE